MVKCFEIRNYRFENSKFIDVELTDGGEYAIVVWSEAHIRNVEFTLSNSKIGTVKIEYSRDVTIENCILTGCSVSNGNVNAIYVAQPVSSNDDAKSVINVDNCVFRNYGNNGYSFCLSISRNASEGSQFNIRNSLTEFESKDACELDSD